jgi:hypothetical protein
MTSKQKKAIFLLVFVALLLTFLLSLNYLASTFINLDAVKSELRERFSRQAGGTIAYRSIDLSLFPLLHAVIHNADISVPGKVQATVRTLRLYPAILPLLRGKLTIRSLGMGSPEVTIMLPGPAETGRTGDGEPLEDRIRNSLTSALAAFASAAPGLEVEVRNGRVHLRQDGRDLFHLYNLRSTIQFPPGEPSLDMHFESGIGDDISIRVRFNQKSFRGKGDITLRHFHPATVTSLFFPDAALSVGDSDVDLAVHFIFDSSGTFNADVQGRLSRLTIVRGNEKLILKGRDVKAAYRRNNETTRITVDRLKLDSPRLELNGSFFLNRIPRRIRLNIEGTDMEVSSFRKAALVWKDDVPVINNIFSVVRGGRIPAISYRAEVPSFRKLGDAKYFVITGQMKKGNLFVPGPDLNLENVSGTFTIADAVLKGEALGASTDGASGQSGKLTLGLKGTERPFHLDIHLRTDLSKLLPLLRKVVPHRDFLNEIGQLYNVKGSAAGRLVLGESLKDVKVRLEVSDLNLSAAYDRLPYPLKIEAGKVSYDESMVRVEHMRGELGGSTFSDLDAELDLGKEPSLKISSAATMLLMDEIHPWVMSYEGMRKYVMDAEAVTGVVEVTSLRLEGPLMEPGAWNFKGDGRVRDLTIITPLLPDPLEMEDGRFEVTQKRLSLMENRMKSGDAFLSLSGVIEDYLDEQKKSDLTFHGEAGKKTTEWVSRLIDMPAELVPRSPVSVSNARLTRDGDSQTSFTGDLAISEGPGLSLDVTVMPGETMIRELSVKDRESDASMALTLNDEEINVDYAGRLTPGTMEDLFVSPLLKRQMMDGDLHVRISRDVPLQFSAVGNLSAENVYLPLAEDVPSSIESISVEAAGDRVTISNAALMLADRRLTAEGIITSTEKGMRFALDTSSDGIEWDRLSRVFDTDLMDRERTSLSDMIDSGTIDFDSGFFSYGDYTLKPFRGKVTLSGDDARVDVTEAELCNVSISGTMNRGAQTVSVDVHPHADQKELKPAIDCLFHVQKYMTGTFDLDGSVTGEGAKGTLADNLTGPWKFTADNGRIYQYSLIAKILAFLNLTEIFRGQTPDLLDEGFAYKTITANGEVKGSDFVLNEAVIDGASMKIVIQGAINYKNRQTDLKVLVSPLKTVDFIIGKIPVIREILGGNLITIPVRVTGDFNDPDIFYMNPVDIGSELISIMKNTLNLPGKIIKPFIPEEQKQGK